MRRLLNRKGQNSLEYIFLIAVVVAAVLAIQIYFKRALQGRARSSFDSIGDQYDTGYMDINRTITIDNRTVSERFGWNEDNTPAKGVQITNTSGGDTTRNLSSVEMRNLSAETLFE